MTTFHLRLIQAFAGGALALGAVGSHATLVSSIPVGIASSTVTFTPYSGSTTPRTLATSTDVGAAEGLESVLLSFNDPDPERILGAVPTSLGSNGQWPANGAFAGLNTNTGTMIFSFGRAMNFVGGFVNYAPNAFDGNPTIAALNAQGDVIEEATLAFDFSSPAGVGLGQFIGFSHAGADIWGFSLNNGRVVVDDLSFGTTAAAGVPEPSALTLVFAALVALGWKRRRRT